MSLKRVFVLTSLAMIAFAGNSLLCRMALRSSQIDPASFTSIRILSGAVVLFLVTRTRRVSTAGPGDWSSALALFGYAAGFSYAYVDLPAGIGALLLFGAVQVTMIGYGLTTGERLVVDSRPACSWHWLDWWACCCPACRHRLLEALH